MEKIFFILSILFFSQVKAIDEEMIQKGYKYSPDFDAYYKFVDRNYIFAWSNEFCSTEGSRLFFPESDEEAAFAFQLVPKGISKIWIGAGGSELDDWNYLHDTEGGDGSYLTKTCPDLKYVRKESGIAMKSPKDYEFVFWRTKLPYICRKSMKPRTPTEERLTQLKKIGYVYDKRYNSLYKYKRVEYYYSRELLYCNYEGGTTFLPESKEEALITKDMNLNGITYIGISKFFGSEYKSIEGKKIPDSYIDWFRNRPSSKEDYIAIDTSGNYYGVTSNSADGYICKIKLPVVEITTPKPREEVPEIPNFFQPIKSFFPCSNSMTLEEEMSIKNYQSLKQFNSFYKFYGERAFSLWTAALICSSDGSSLFYPESEEEAEAVFELIPQEVEKIFIGITKTPTRKHFALKGKFASGLNETERLQDLSLRRGIVLCKDLKYEVVNTTEEFKFVCKKNTEVTPYPTGIQKMDLMVYGYNFYVELNAWYKFYDVAETFEYAFIQCLTDGGTLFAPETKMELKEIMFDMEVSNPVWLGVTKFLRNYYVTVEGRLASNNFYNWARNQPDLTNDYVALNKNGKYFTAGKSDKYGFICKKSVKNNCDNPDQTMLSSTISKDIGIRISVL